MSNINWNQLSNNYNNFNGMNTKNVQNTPLNQANANTQQQRTPLEVLFPKYISQLSQTVNELAMLNQQQMTNMIRDLLQFPRNFEQLLTQLAVNPGEINQKIAVLLLASNMNITQLSALLKNSSKTAMTNLYQMLAQFNITGMSLKDEQIGQLTKLISFIAASSSSDVQTLRTTMLMYLPWLPINAASDFNASYENSDEKKASSDEDSIFIYITTKNYGIVKIFLYKENDGYDMDVNCSEDFPKEKFNESVKADTKFVLKNPPTYTVRKNTDDEQKKSETDVSFSKNSKVTPQLLIIIHAIIKLVADIDAQGTLVEKRKEEL